ncbi:hypothetical protein Lal_00025819 [Lupinus albus]|nr:hypothetical protein Lal_00025819 [Lupinus albus]
MALRSFVKYVIFGTKNILGSTNGAFIPNNKSYLCVRLYKCTIRGNSDPLHPINPEIHSTCLHLDSESFDRVIIADTHTDFDYVSMHYTAYSDYENMTQPSTPLGPRERTLREHVTPDFTYESLCIQYPNDDMQYVLKTRLIYLLPKFHGLAYEDSHKHLNEFHIVCPTMKPHDAFPHSLEGSAKDCLFYLAPRSIIKSVFLGKFFPAPGPLQLGKTFHESGNSMKRFYLSTMRDSRDHVQATHYYHISKQLFLQYFYEGLNNMDKSIIDLASGDALGYMTPVESKSLIEKMASNYQQFNPSNDVIVVRGVHTDAVRQEKHEREIVSLTTLKSLIARVCDICTFNDHYDDDCPSMLEPRTGDHPEAYAAKIYNNKPQQQQKN